MTLFPGDVAYELTIALCSLAAGRNGAFVRHDRVHDWGLLIVANP